MNQETQFEQIILSIVKKVTCRMPVLHTGASRLEIKYSARCFQGCSLVSKEREGITILLVSISSVVLTVLHLVVQVKSNLSQCVRNAHLQTSTLLHKHCI